MRYLLSKKIYIYHACCICFSRLPAWEAGCLKWSDSSPGIICGGCACILLLPTVCHCNVFVSPMVALWDRIPFLTCCPPTWRESAVAGGWCLRDSCSCSRTYTTLGSRECRVEAAHTARSRCTAAVWCRSLDIWGGQTASARHQGSTQRHSRNIWAAPSARHFYNFYILIFDFRFFDFYKSNHTFHLSRFTLVAELFRMPQLGIVHTFYR